MKKKFQRIIATVACLTTVFGVSACAAAPEEKETGKPSKDYVPTIDESLVDPSLNGTLSIRFYKKGYGDSWLMNAVSAFKTMYPNVTVKTSSTTEPKVIYGEEIGGIEDKYDIFMSESGGLMEHTDRFVSVKDVYDSVPVGEDKKISEKLDPIYLRSYKTKDGDYYYIPSNCGAYGLVYNRDIIEEDAVPVTTDELENLCKEIKTTGVNPIVYSGGDSSIYWSFLYTTWLIQYEGKENYFQSGEGKIYDENTGEYVIDVSSAYLPGELKALQVCEDLLWQPKNYASSQCVGYNANSAQRILLQGDAGMMFTGSWVMNEMATMISAYGVEVNDFGMMKVPVISSIKDKCTTIENDAELSALVKAIDKGETALSGEGYEVSRADFDKVAEARSFVYAGSEGAHFGISKLSKNVDLAKTFLKFFYSDEGIRAVGMSKTGCWVPAKSTKTLDLGKNNAFLTDVYSILSTKNVMFKLATSAITAYCHVENMTIEKQFGSVAMSDRTTAVDSFNAKKALWTANGNQKFIDEMRHYGYMD